MKRFMGRPTSIGWFDAFVWTGAISPCLEVYNAICIYIYIYRHIPTLFPFY